MTPDPILDKLDLILSTSLLRRDENHADEAAVTEQKIRQLLADVAIEYYVRGTALDECGDKVAERFGVAPPSEKEKT